MTTNSLWITHRNLWTTCPGQVPPKHPLDTPLQNAICLLTCGTSCPRTCPLILKRGVPMKTRSSQPYPGQVPLLGIPGLEDLSPAQKPETQNPRSDLSRTGRGQRGRSRSRLEGPDLSLSPPLSRGDRSGTAPTPTKNHTPKTTPCNPYCVRCGRPEDRGNCAPCTTTCTHNLGPHTAGVCITRTRAYARTHTSPITGRSVTVVPQCPHCGHAHIHAAIDNPHRTAPCGPTYVLHEVTQP